VILIWGGSVRIDGAKDEEGVGLVRMLANMGNREYIWGGGGPKRADKK